MNAADRWIRRGRRSLVEGGLSIAPVEPDERPPRLVTQRARSQPPAPPPPSPDDYLRRGERGEGVWRDII